MTTHRINIKSLSSEREFAARIEGFDSEPGDTIIVRNEHGDECAVRVGAQFPELAFVGAGGEQGSYRTARVMIQRPDLRHYGGEPTLVPASVTWSSSSSDAEPGDAPATASLLAWAASVALQLNVWARDGELPRLVPAPKFAEGAVVDVAVTEPGGAEPRWIGSVRGHVLSAGGEYDVVIDEDVEDMEDVAHLLGRCDVTLDDLFDPHGGRYILRNCQPEQLTAVAS